MLANHGVVCVSLHMLVHVAESVAFATFSFLQAPTDLASKALELNLQSHALSY